MGSGTTDHLEQAAAKAVELAAELCTPLSNPENDDDVIIRRIRVASHLTYLAGLIHGRTVREPIPWTRAGVLRDVDGRQIWPPLRSPWAEDADPGDHDPPETAAEHLANECEKYAKRWHQAVDQRDELVRAARAMLQHEDVRRVVRRPFLNLLDRIEAERL